MKVVKIKTAQMKNELKETIQMERTSIKTVAMEKNQRKQPQWNQSK